jgi:hypothetical protein
MYTQYHYSFDPSLLRLDFGGNNGGGGKQI